MLFNQQQDEFKNIILGETFQNKHYVLTGEAGTGKTLLLLDIAKHICMAGKKVLYIFCGNIYNNFNKKIKEHFTNLDIIEIKNLNLYLNINYDLIIIDEMQYITHNSWDNANKMLNKCDFTIVSGDTHQYLSDREEKRKIFETYSQYLKQTCKNNCFKLSNKIRTNKKMFDFITKLLDYSKKIKVHNTENIDVIFANNDLEAFSIIRLYKDNDYSFINFTTAKFGTTLYDAFNTLKDYDSHSVKGQDIERVLIVLKNNFVYYYKDGKEILTSMTSHPTNDYDYRKMLVQALGRVVEKLAIIVVEDKNLFLKIMNIKNQRY